MSILAGRRLKPFLCASTEPSRRAVGRDPRNDYAATVAAGRHVTDVSIGIAIPRCISRITGLMQNANSTWLNGRPFDRDLADALKAPDSGKRMRLGGVVIDGKLLNGPRGIGAE